MIASPPSSAGYVQLIVILVVDSETVVKVEGASGSYVVVTE